MEKDRLEDFLKVGETVLWKGDPEKFDMIDGTHRAVLLKKLLISMAISILLACLYVWYTIHTGRQVSTGFAGAIAACGLISPMTVFTDAISISRMHYAATDQRLIIYEDSVRQMDYYRIKDAIFVTDKEGHTSLLCGKNGVKAGAAKARSLTVYGDVNESESTDDCKNFAMYAVDDPDGLRKALRKQLPGCRL